MASLRSLRRNLRRELQREIDHMNSPLELLLEIGIALFFVVTCASLTTIIVRISLFGCGVCP